MAIFDQMFGKAKGKNPLEAQTPEEVKQASEGAKERMKSYDTMTASDTVGGAAATMRRAEEAARAGAAGISDQAVAQAVKAGRTGGMMPGQAALGAQGQAAGAYGQGMAQGIDQFGQNVQREAQLGESMSGRLTQSGQTQAQIAIANAANEAAMQQAKMQADAAKRQANQGLFGNILGGIAGVGSLFSDRELKEDVEPAGSLSDSLAKIKAYAYKYKGSDRPETGVMAQDLEKTEAAPSVHETAQGKVVDTDRLTTINTAAIGEQGRRIKDIERLIGELKAVKHG